MHLRLGILVLSGILLAVGCTTAPESKDSVAAEQAVRERASSVLEALQASDGKRLADLTHPHKGVRFSPYAFVRTGEDGDLVFTPAQLRELESDQTVYRWGTQDGSGRPIDLTLGDYLKRFAAQDYTAAQVGYNQILKQGNTRVNIREAYPDGVFVEYHLPGTGEHADFTWSSIRLVFEQGKGTWYLVGVINDRWTI